MNVCEWSRILPCYERLLFRKQWHNFFPIMCRRENKIQMRKSYPCTHMHNYMDVEGVQFTLVNEAITLIRMLRVEEAVCKRMSWEALKQETACSELKCINIWMLRFLSCSYTFLSTWRSLSTPSIEVLSICCMHGCAWWSKTTLATMQELDNSSSNSQQFPITKNNSLERSLFNSLT